MPTDSHTTASVFCDASFKDGLAGFGYLAKHSNDMVVAARHLGRHAWTANIAEALALQQAVAETLEMFPGVSRVTVSLDSLAVVEAINGKRPPGKDIIHIVVAMIEMATARGLVLDARWIKGHAPETVSGSANGVAHNLAYLGRHGETFTHRTEYGLDWRDRLIAIDERLHHLPPPYAFTVEGAASTLQVSRETIQDLLRHGHLDTDGFHIQRRSIDAIRPVLAKMRRERDKEQPAPSL